MSDFVIKAYTPKELYCAYNVSYKVFKSWMEKIRDKVGAPVAGVYTPAQVKIIVEHFDFPEIKIDQK